MKRSDLIWNKVIIEEREDIPEDIKDYITELHKIIRRVDDLAIELIESGLSEGFTGAEIEQAVIDALYECFDRGEDLGMKDLSGAVESTVPLSVTMSEKIKALREWSRNRARPASSGGEKSNKQNSGRRKIAA